MAPRIGRTSAHTQHVRGAALAGVPASFPCLLCFLQSSNEESDRLLAEDPGWLWSSGQTWFLEGFVLLVRETSLLMMRERKDFREMRIPELGMMLG